MKHNLLIARIRDALHQAVSAAANGVGPQGEADARDHAVGVQPLLDPDSTEAAPRIARRHNSHRSFCLCCVREDILRSNRRSSAKCYRVYIVTPREAFAAQNAQIRREPNALDRRTSEEAPLADLLRAGGNANP